MVLLQVVKDIRHGLRHIILTFSLCISLTVLGQGIFSDLEYDESFIRSKLAEYAVSVDSVTESASIPENIYYRLLFREILSDAVLLATIPVADVSILETLPAHENHSFVVKDQQELAALCESLASDSSSDAVLNAANAFDASRIRREQELDRHYGEVVGSLSLEGRETVLQLFLTFTESKNITYSTFSMSGLAADVPEIARAVLQNGCDNFSTQLASYIPQELTLKDQLYALPTTTGQ